MEGIALPRPDSPAPDSARSRADASRGPGAGEAGPRTRRHPAEWHGATPLEFLSAPHSASR
jgi:hypothetical protein